MYDETISVERYKSKIHSIVSHNYFENVILCMIIASSILLATETKTWPVPGSSTANAYQAVDIAFTTIFTAEMALKLFAYGLYAKPTAYLRSYFSALVRRRRDNITDVATLLGKWRRERASDASLANHASSAVNS